MWWWRLLATLAAEICVESWVSLRAVSCLMAYFAVPSHLGVLDPGRYCLMSRSL